MKDNRFIPRNWKVGSPCGAEASARSGRSPGRRGETLFVASNIAINRGEAQPVHFRFGEEIQLTDSEGTEMAVRVMAIVGRSALVEYSVLGI